MNSFGTQLSALPTFLLFGLIGGAAYFCGVWFNARLFSRKRPFWSILGGALIRFGLLAVILTLIARQGALPLLLTALGIVVARAILIRRMSEALE